MNELLSQSILQLLRSNLSNTGANLYGARIEQELSCGAQPRKKLIHAERVQELFQLEASKTYGSYRPDR